MIIDKIHLLIQAGNGGNGCESYVVRSDRKRLHTGGNGGKGGDVIIRASNNASPIASLRFKQHIIGNSGEHGSGNRKRGHNGEDLVILVPCNSKIFDREKQILLRELINDGDEILLLEGGEGGRGNCGGKEATHGEEGQRLDVEIHIRLQADIFLVGLPNSGKSTLLNALAGTNVRQGTYPFATRDPEKGVWNYSDFEQATLCELPSLYEHSHEGRGMGNSFVKHLEMAGLVLYVVDPVSQFATGIKQGYEILREQVAKISEDLLKKPSALVVNKIDLTEAKEALEKEKDKPELPTFVISASTGEGMDALQSYLIEAMEKREKV